MEKFKKVLILFAVFAIFVVSVSFANSDSKFMVKSIMPTTIEVYLNEQVKLPKTVTVIKTDNTRIALNVTWQITQKTFTKQGTYKFTGIVANTKLRAPLVIIVKNKPLQSTTSTTPPVTTKTTASVTQPTTLAPEPTTTAPSIPAITNAKIQLLGTTTYRVTQTVDITNTNFLITDLAVWLPVPETNEYQTISNITLNGATFIKDSNGKNDVAFYNSTDFIPTLGTTKSFVLAYDATISSIYCDINYLESNLILDSNNPIRLKYSGKDGVYIDPTNGTIINIAKTLRSQSKNDLEFVRAAYDYVARNYKYLDPLTGVRPLADTLSKGGGDCGNLTAIFVSILRSEGIASRPLVARRVDGSFHVWADFYSPRDGWIPVDVTYKNAKLSRDYFGTVNFHDNGIILGTAYNVTLPYKGDSSSYAILQRYLYRFMYAEKISKSGPSYPSSTDDYKGTVK